MMPGPIISARSLPLAGPNAALPNVSGALQSWLIPMTFGQITKTVVNFIVKEIVTPVSFQGVWQPLTLQKLRMKPEGQRSWSWYMVHTTTDLALKVDDVVSYLGTQYRVTEQNDYHEYGYFEYHLVNDFTGSGPNVP